MTCEGCCPRERGQDRLSHQDFEVQTDLAYTANSTVSSVCFHCKLKYIPHAQSYPSLSLHRSHYRN